MPVDQPIQVAPHQPVSDCNYQSGIQENFDKFNAQNITNTTLLVYRDCGEGRKPARRRRLKQKKRKTGGWRVTSGMKTKEAFEIKEGIHCLQRARKPLTAFITLRPPSELVSDRKRQDWCRRKAYNFRRKLMRHGLEYIALAVFEKPNAGQLHLHLLVHVAEDNFSLLKVMENLPEIDVRQCHGKHQTYVLKNRLPTHPDFEKELQKILPRKKAAPFRDKRWSFSKDALGYIATAGELQSASNG